MVISDTGRFYLISVLHYSLSRTGLVISVVPRVPYMKTDDNAPELIKERAEEFRIMFLGQCNYRRQELISCGTRSLHWFTYPPVDFAYYGHFSNVHWT